MKIRLITPAPGVRDGNRVTALRYAGFLRKLGHRVVVQSSYDGENCDLLLALHARKSFDSICRFRDRRPNSPLVVVLTGTDLYRDIKTNRKARRSLELASHLVVLQRSGLDEIPNHLLHKASVIYQSANGLAGELKPPSRYFRVCVVGHLRSEKDPFRAASAVRRLPARSRVKVLHVGSALSERMESQAIRESSANPRYRWVGALPYGKTRRLIASSHLVAITSRIEGSSNVLCEALASSVPVVATRIPGLIGTLGQDYPGYFAPEDTQGLADLICRAEWDPDFYERLRSCCKRLAHLVTPQREIEAWKRLLSDLRL